MSRIHDLIAEHCPDGVEHKNLGDVANLRRGTAITEKTAMPGNIPVVANGPGSTYSHDASNRTGETVVVARSGAYAGLVSYWNQPIFLTDAFSVHPDPSVLSSKFVYYILQNKQENLHSMKKGAGVPHVRVKDFESFMIPVPPLEVQREIVRVLDTFAALEAELEAELEARKQQYAYYRDALLNFHNIEGGRPLSEVALIVRGASPRPIQSFLTTDEEGVPWIKIGDVPRGGKYITKTAERVTPAGAANSRRVYPGDFVLSNSMSFGRPYISKLEGCIHDGWLSISNFADSFVADFLYQLLRSTQVQREFSRRAGAGTVKNLNADIVRSIVVPVPPLGEQARIVGILDSFDALVNDLSVGLPAELAARRKQYAYYRDSLLAFPEAGNPERVDTSAPGVVGEVTRDSAKGRPLQVAEERPI